MNDIIVVHYLDEIFLWLQTTCPYIRFYECHDKKRIFTIKSLCLKYRMRNLKARISKLERTLSPERSCIRFTGLMEHLCENISQKQTKKSVIKSVKLKILNLRRQEEYILKVAMKAIKL